MKDLLDDVLGYSLDEEQRRVVYSSSKHILVVAGAGSGKSLTIIGKIRYLIEEKGYRPEEILCISFTHASATSLKEKLQNYYHYDLDVYTFHKLSLEILKDSSEIPYTIAPSDLLEYCVDEYFHGIILENDESMKNVLKYFGKRPSKDITTSYLEFISKFSKEFSKFQNLLVKFLKLFKGQAFSSEKFHDFFLLNRKKYWFQKWKKNLFFLTFAQDIYHFYQQELTSSHTIDFDDMISIATKKIASSFEKKYRYVIIDEYQDTSYTRFLLIQEILKKTDASLLVVGDDFQSIYQFTGCNLNMFLNFRKFFPDVSTYQITHTYRNSQELVNIAGNFIMKNPRQIHKQLQAKKHLEKPIELYYTNHPKDTLKKLLHQNSSFEILILGRNNRDIVPFLDDTLQMKEGGFIQFSEIPDLKIQYLTIHKSKGLESEQVIFIHVEEDLLGIPSQMEDDEILKFVLKKEEYYPFEEERRLFYVALTRTKNKVYILSNKSRPSRFLKELAHDLKNSTYNEM